MQTHPRSTAPIHRQRLQAYLDLVQTLLTCPRGEEWIYLKQQEELIDATFVQVLEPVAAQLFREGDRQSAKYLYNWAAQLHHILLKSMEPAEGDLDQTQAYLELIQALIDCPEEAVGEVLRCHEELVGPGLVAMMQRVATQLANQHQPETAQFLADLADQLNQTWIQTHLAMPRSPSSTAPAPDPAQSETDDTTQVNTQTPAEQTARSLTSQPDQPQDPNPYSDPWQTDAPLSSALQLKVPQQIANGLHEVALLLHQINRSLKAQTEVLQALATHSSAQPSVTQTSEPTNPLWYMDVLERACEGQWILSTTEVEQLIGVKPKDQGGDGSYQRGCWRFEKVGKLGAQTAWRVQKN